jgi:hypothetical protein
MKETRSDGLTVGQKYAGHVQDFNHPFSQTPSP